MLVWLGVGVGRNNFWLLIEWSLVHHPKTCYHPICSLTLSKCMPPSRLWLHSSLLLSPPGNNPYSPLSLTGHWPFHDRLDFTPEFLPSTISLCKPTFLPLTLPVYILHFQPLSTTGLCIPTCLPVCTRPLFLSTQLERYDPTFHPFSWQPLFNPTPFSPTHLLIIWFLYSCALISESSEKQNIPQNTGIGINRAGHWAQLGKPDLLNPVISDPYKLFHLKSLDFHLLLSALNLTSYFSKKGGKVAVTYSS